MALCETLSYMFIETNLFTIITYYLMKGLRIDIRTTIITTEVHVLIITWGDPAGTLLSELQNVAGSTHVIIKKGLQLLLSLL